MILNIVCIFIFYNLKENTSYTLESNSEKIIRAKGHFESLDSVSSVNTKNQTNNGQIKLLYGGTDLID